MPYFIIKDKGKTEVIKTGIDGVFIVEPHILKDARSYFFESFSHRGSARTSSRQCSTLRQRNRNSPLYLTRQERRRMPTTWP